jgi:hypothetical protein
LILSLRSNPLQWRGNPIELRAPVAERSARKPASRFFCQNNLAANQREKRVFKAEAGCRVGLLMQEAFQETASQ